MRKTLNDNRFSELLNDEEGTSKDAFMSTCLHNPSLRDRFPILVHSFQNKKKASPFSQNSLFKHTASKRDTFLDHFNRS